MAAGSRPLVVTGAGGFLAGALIRLLVDAGRDVIAVSRGDHSVAGAACVRVDDYAETPAGAGSVLVHLAEPRNAAAVTRAHIAAATDTLQALVAKGFSGIVYGSSAAVYGDAARAPHSEDEPVHAASAYAAMKRAGEERVLAAGGCAARLANIYGPGMAADNVVSHILRQIPGDGPLFVRNTGPVRDFIWVADAAAAFVRLAVEPMAGVFNVGTGVGTAVGALARLALDIAGQPDRPVVSEGPPAESWCILDHDTTTRVTGWRPETDLRAGLTRLIEGR